MTEAAISPEDTAPVSEAPAPDTAEYNAAMAARAEQGLKTDSNDPGSLLAGKYKTEDDLSKGLIEALKAKHGGNLEAAYKEIESGLGKKADTQPADPSKAGEPEVETTDEETQESADETESAGLDLNAVATEISENGEMTPETSKKVIDGVKSMFNCDDATAKGIVDTYLQSAETQAQQLATQLFDMVGGEKVYDQMLEWATSNMKQDAVSEFNSAISSGSIARMQNAVSGLKQAYTDAEGPIKFDPLRPSEAGSKTADAFRSWEEVKSAMRSPQYRKDPAYRADVERRLQSSQL